VVDTADGKLTPAAPGHRRQDAVRVVYIAGAARSGSTVLNGVLGNHARIQAAGELARLGTDAWLQNLYCACGERSKECPFWTEVHERWRASNDGMAVERYVALQRRAEGFGRWPLLIRQSQRAANWFEVYAGQTAAILRAIRDAAGASVVVDSSKNVARCFALSLMRDVDLKVIHLVRDPRGVVGSHVARDLLHVRAGVPVDIEPLPAWRAALYWDRVNGEVEILRKLLAPDRSLRVRYEDFTSETGTVLKRIGSLIGEDMDAIGQAIEARARPLSFDHAVAGNRVRMTATIDLRLDEEWRRTLRARDRRVTEVLCRPLMNRYGYAR
jgi:hypothetical protein